MIDNVARFWKKVSEPTSSGCRLWTASVDKDGYGKFQINLGGSANQRHVRAHRYAWFLQFGVEPVQQLLHSCDMPACVNVAHLSEGSQKQNIRDAKVRDRRANADRHPRAILTKVKALQLRELYAAGRGYAWLMEFFGISKPGVYMVLSKRTWNYPECFPESTKEEVAQ